jgi:hypothetical protein
MGDGDGDSDGDDNSAGDGNSNGVGGDLVLLFCNLIAR